jgi:alkylhydroperoxidase family enzyme
VTEPDERDQGDASHWSNHAVRIRPRSRRDLGLLLGSLIGVARIASRGRAVNVFATIAGNRRIALGWLHFAARLMLSGTLPRRDAELIILRVAYNCRSRYEWIQHRAIARRVGLDDATLARVALGPDAPGWTPRQKALLLAVDELHHERSIGAPTWQLLEQHLDTPALIELCVLVGHYEMTAMTLNSLGVEIEGPALALERSASEGRTPGRWPWSRPRRR